MGRFPEEKGWEPVVDSVAPCRGRKWEIDRMKNESNEVKNEKKEREVCVGAMFLACVINLYVSPGCNVAADINKGNKTTNRKTGNADVITLLPIVMTQLWSAAHKDEKMSSTKQVALCMYVVTEVCLWFVLDLCMCMCGYLCSLVSVTLAWVFSFENHSHRHTHALPPSPHLTDSGD